MKPAPNPTEYAQVHDPEQVALVRRVRCSSYDVCLGTAMKARWRGFSCERCQVRDDANIEVPLRLRDLVAESAPNIRCKPGEGSLTNMCRAGGPDGKRSKRSWVDGRHVERRR